MKSEEITSFEALLDVIVALGRDPSFWRLLGRSGGLSISSALVFDGLGMMGVLLLSVDVVFGGLGRVLRFAERRSLQRPPLKTGLERTISSLMEKLTSMPSSAMSLVGSFHKDFDFRKPPSCSMPR